MFFTCLCGLTLFTPKNRFSSVGNCRTAICIREQFSVVHHRILQVKPLPVERIISYNHGQTSWDTFVSLGRFPIHTGPTPPLIPQTMLDACIQNFFRVSTLYRVGGGRTARKFRKGCTVLRGNREMTEKYEYCSTVPRTFVQDCRLFYLYIGCCRAEDRACYACLLLLLTHNMLAPDIIPRDC